MKKRALFWNIVMLQSLLIIFLGYYIWHTGNVLGESISLSVIPKEDIQVSPDGDLEHFYEPNKNIEIKRTEKFVGYIPVMTINSDHLNERFDYPLQKDKETFRIVVLGDSFTYGLFVDTKENYAEKLEDKLNLSCHVKRFEVINLGMEGYDIEYSVERFKRRGEKYSPDLVMWLLQSDDLYQITEITSQIEKKKRLELVKNGTFKTFDEKGNYISAYTKAREEFNNLYSKNSIEDYQSKVLERFENLYKGPLFIYTFEFENNDLKNFFKKYASKNDNVKLDLGIVDFRKENAALKDGHPNSLGHTLIANNLFESLKRNKLIDCIQL